ncbi:MAG TPA: 23S rRNA (guanosine(2251)-2'-O)-methyltransferase RlmB [Candidatus Hydrogenedentes bacterium]|nr:23S rRNA (guanosine(2251)-2'-O)-methyltransferase RlmB [Candidatus Hydrogenedentota bacterium]
MRVASWAEAGNLAADRLTGRIPILESLRARKRRARRLYVLHGAQGIGDILKEAQGLPIEERSRSELDAMTRGAVHQGVVLEIDPLPVHRIETWARQTFPKNAVIVALDSVEDPQNFGAIVRSAAALGACGALFAKDRSAPISAVAQKSAAGAMDYIDLVQTTNLVRGLELLKKAGFWVAGLDGAGEKSLWEADLAGRIVLVVGSEGKGMRRLVTEACDYLLRIPISGPITSLNASVSAAIALAEYARQQQTRPVSQGA